jgi:hypothetical protein
MKNVRLHTENRRGGVQGLVAEDYHGRQRLSLADFGSGVRCFASMIVAIAAAPRPSCVIVEHPQTSLDGKLQEALADFFVEQLGSGRQFIVETHEGPFLDRLRATSDRSHTPEIQILSVERVEGWSRVTQSHSVAVTDGSRREGSSRSRASHKSRSRSA